MRMGLPSVWFSMGEGGAPVWNAITPACHHASILHVSFVGAGLAKVLNEDTESLQWVLAATTAGTLTMTGLMCGAT